MKYIKVRWKHSLSSEPVLLFSEVDDIGWESRKVEVYADGRMGYASKSESRFGSGLSKEVLPPLAEIALDPQFEPVEIDQEEFERAWVRSHE
jgi:hypothetical protein